MQKYLRVHDEQAINRIRESITAAYKIKAKVEAELRAIPNTLGLDYITTRYESALAVYCRTFMLSNRLAPTFPSNRFVLLVVLRG